MNHAYPTIAAMLCVLFLTGCSKSPARETGQEYGDAQETAVLEDIPFTPETIEEDTTEPGKDTINNTEPNETKRNHDNLFRTQRRTDPGPADKGSRTSGLRMVCGGHPQRRYRGNNPLTGLTKLERLGLAENRIQDISPLESLANLFDLALDGNEISDISALSGLAHLNQAGLSDNRISDLSPLAGKEELMFASVSGNPCTDLQPLWEVPLLFWKSCEPTEEKTESAEAWIEKEHPEVTEYTCIDYAEGDLDGDGRKDMAFVIDGTFGEQEQDELYADTRRLYVLLQQKDGSMREMAEVPYLSGADAGGMRGDPYRGIFMGDGYLMLKQSWGSSTGTTATEIYRCRNGELEQAKSISVGDSRFADGYDVSVTDREHDTWSAYAIAMDGFRMVRVNLADAAHPFHKAFPRTELYDVSYSLYEEKPDTDMTAEEALDCFMDAMAGNGEKADLPYAPWQKTGYELLKGVELPDYYYTVPGTEEIGEEGTDNESQADAWEGDYIFYDGYGMTRKAVTETIRICKDRNVLMEYLLGREKEVVTIMMSLFDEEQIMKSFIKSERYDVAKEKAFLMLQSCPHFQRELLYKCFN